MRIAQVCPYDMDRPGGVQAHIRDLGTALEELGHQVTVFAPFVPQQGPRVSGPEIIRLGSARKIGFGGTVYEISIALGAEKKRLTAAVEGGRFDVMHYHTMWTPLLPVQVFRRSKSANVATFHDTPAPTLEGRVLTHAFRAMSKLLLPRLDGVITPSEAPLAHLAKVGPPVTILPPATNLSRFATARPPRRARFDDGRINILFLGRLEERKGATLLLEAYLRLVMEELPVRLIIAGQGEREHALREFAAAHSLPNLEFTGGFFDSEAPQLYADCDIFCAPSPYGESFGIVIAEAMASGKPVVAAANAGYRSVLTGEGARFLTPPGDSSALASALRTLVTDAPLRARLGEWGREQAMRYDARTVAPKFVEVYEEAIERFKRREARTGN
ncbi:MAG TPA: glycosyltransferase family 4 protein [Rhizomicrobium sp.]|nr:glycosyltransferase family 4 protein [Rhizomicrobium sp.]